MAGRFDGQVIVVTGGARGIGADIVARAVAEGARGRRDRRGQRRSDRCPGSATSRWT